MQQLSPDQAGMLFGLPKGGSARLGMLSDPEHGAYSSPIAGTPIVDVQPLAGMGLENYGMLGQLAGLAGNITIDNMMEQQGATSMGNAGSYSQAMASHAYKDMMSEVSNQVAGRNTEGYYRSFRGMSALAGVPFTKEREDAARRLSETVADNGVMLSAFASEFMDAISGERGSVQSMANQMMEANRYRIDPATGQMGYSADSNVGMITGAFDRMFSGDNYQRMEGMRAGDMGQLYKRLSAEGLVGPKGSLRDRTLQALNEAQDAGELDQIGEESGGVDLRGNLGELNSDEMSRLRKSSTLSNRIQKLDTQQITSTLESYVGTLSAMREVFGENGDPNAPVPKLLNAMNALTNGQMHKFDPAQLQTMVRDMQSMSQMSGKSIDQMLAMSQTAAGQGRELGIGTTFAPTAVNIAATTGMAFQDAGGATGFGALNRSQAEQASMSYFNRGMASEMSNSLGALGRIEESGGFSDNAQGRRLSAIVEAARAGKTSFVDPDTGEELAIPRRESEFRALVSSGGAEGISGSTFNQMLGDRTSNLRMLSSDTGLQEAAFKNQANEIDLSVARKMGNRLSETETLRDSGLDKDKRNAVSRRASAAALAALSDLSPQEQQDPTTRNQAMASALRGEFEAAGLTVTDSEMMNTAASLYGQAEQGVQRYGFESFTAYSQVFGKDVRESRELRASQAKATSQVNTAMSGLGPRGSMTQRLFTAMQRQGDRGGKADLSTFVTDLFGVDRSDVEKRFKSDVEAITQEKGEIEQLQAQLGDATPERRKALSEEIKSRAAALKGKVDAVSTALGESVEDGFVSKELGLDEDTYSGLSDLSSLLTKDVSSTAEALGMTVEEYRASLSDKTFQPRGNEMTEKEQKDAERDETQASRVQARLQSVTGQSPKAKAERARLQNQLKDINSRREERYKKSGLDITKSEDVQWYRNNLRNQDAVRQHYEDWDNYDKAARGLRESGMSDDEIEEGLEGFSGRVEEARNKKAELEESMRISDDDRVIAEAVGLDADSPNDAFVAFNASLSSDDVDVDNRKLLAKNLTKAGELEIGDEDSTSMEKLDLLTDMVSGKSSKERRSIAQKMGMDLESMDLMLRQTKFLGLEEDTDGYSSKDLQSAFSRVAGKSVEESAEKDTVSKVEIVSGTLKITGNVVQGKGTLEDAIA